MTKRVSRPWDKHSNNNVSSRRNNGPSSRFLLNVTSGNNDETNDTRNNDNHHQNDEEDNDDGNETAIRYIEVDNIKYYSDRFYLNHTVYDNDINDDATTTEQHHHCTCGAKQAPPLLNLSRLIQSMDIDAAILGTFSFELPYLQRSLPSLFGPQATIPTFVMHGKKGWTIENYCNGGDNDEGNEDDIEPESEPSIPTQLHTPTSAKTECFPRQTGSECIDTTKFPLFSSPQDDNTAIMNYDDDEGTDCASLLTQEHQSPNNTPERRKHTSVEQNDMISNSNKDNFNHWDSRKFINKNNNNTSIDSVIEKTVNYDDGTATTQRRQIFPKMMQHKKEYTVPPKLYFSEVQPVWFKKNHVVANPWLDTTTNSTSSNNKKDPNRVYRPGVHHPKYMILFEKSGSMIVVVSTANFTRPTSTDATWLQRFPQLTINQKQNDNSKTLRKNSALKQQSSSSQNNNNNDFGIVLANFLHCEMLATQTGQMDVQRFLQLYCHLNSLKELQNKFDYSKSQVYLIPVVPGDYEGAERQLHHMKHRQLQQQTNKQVNANDSVVRASTAVSGTIEEGLPTIHLYGRQRVAYILEMMCTGSNPSIPRELLSDQDRLIFQPTSFGAEWNQRNMAELIRSYMTTRTSSGFDNNNKQRYGPNGFLHRTLPRRNTSNVSDECVLGRIDIVWPTENLVQKARRIRCASRRESPRSVHDDVVEFSSTNNTTKVMEKVKLDKGNEGYLFLSSDTFNSIDLCCLSQMVMYERSYPPQHTKELVPHMKSVCRLFQGNDNRLRKDFAAVKAEEYFSWYLLTSACLSRGAQGEDTVGRSPSSDAVSYSNFELGILFCSQLQSSSWSRGGGDGNHRLYCWKPSKCSCRHRSDGANNSNKAMTRTIHLPIPYCLRPSRYQEDIDEADFCETPYFHEIPPGTGCVGHMLLTPFGSKATQEYKNAGL